MRLWPEIFLALLLIGILVSRPVSVQADSKEVSQAGDAGSYSWISNLNNTLDNSSHYHNYSEIVEIAELLNSTYPTITNVFSIGKSWENRSIYCVELTNKEDKTPKPQVLFVGLHHARERISAEIPLYFVTLIASNYQTNADIRLLLDHSDIYVIPALNVDGLDLQTMNQWQRKNAHNYGSENITTPHDVDGDGQVEEYVARFGNVSTWYEGTSPDQGTYQVGVDLNRNYGYQWDSWHYGAILDPGSEVYRGPAPFSEPETQAMRDFALEHNFTYAISFHSGAQCVYYPWAYTINPSPDDELFKEVAGNLSKVAGGVPFIQGGKSDPASGEWGDWMYSNRSVYSFTCETFVNNSAWQYKLLEGTEQIPELTSYSGVMGAYNPSPGNMEKVIKKWLPVFPYIANVSLSYTPPSKPSPPLPPPPLDQFMATVSTPQVYPGLMVILALVLTTMKVGIRKKHGFRYHNKIAFLT